MGTELVLCFRLPSQIQSTIKISDVNLKNKVEELKTQAAGKTNLPKDSFGKKYILCSLSILLIFLNVVNL